MSSSYTNTDTQSFTITHAKHLASKVATDLKRIQRFYSEPNDSRIAQFESELIEFLKAGYVDTVTYGFKKDDKWIEPTLIYTARELANSAADDDDPGRIRPNADISGASFASYLVYTASWHILSDHEKEAFENKLPIRRTPAPESGIDGFLSSDKTYSSGGRALDRSSVKKY